MESFSAKDEKRKVFCDECHTRIATRAESKDRMSASGPDRRRPRSGAAEAPAKFGKGFSKLAEAKSKKLEAKSK
jgi:hypothetical protein